MVSSWQELTGKGGSIVKRAVKQVAVSALLLLVLCLVCRFVFYRTYSTYYPYNAQPSDSPADFQVISEDPEIATGAVTEIRDGALKIVVTPGQAGETFLQITNAAGETMGYVPARVTRFRTVYNISIGGFSGDTVAMLASTVFWLLTGAIMLWNFFQSKGSSFYQYQTIWFIGFSLFALTTGFCLLEVSIRHMISPANNSMLYVYSSLSGASVRFMETTSIPFIIFASAMAVSNIVLLRHQRFRLQNVLGLLVSILLIAGVVLFFYFCSQDFSGSEQEYRFRSTLENTAATLFAYFECMLAASVICGLKAARHKPAQDKDFIVILGCWFRKDGSLPPLLKGRVDKALSFWHSQKEATGREACFVPSGGQGPDESMPEAEAMRQYLLSQDVPDHLIRPETASKNTLENMSFSKKIIRESSPDAKVVFSTTSYHVFRSGIWANLAGLPAEGIGSKTKWWYWPNAFMRETAGLLRKRWKQEILLLVVLLVWFGTLSMILG